MDALRRNKPIASRGVASPTGSVLGKSAVPRLKRPTDSAKKTEPTPPLRTHNQSPKISNDVSSLTESVSRLTTSSTVSARTVSKQVTVKSSPRPSPVEKRSGSGTSTDSARPKAVTSPDINLINCEICSRRFDPERIGRHREICKKTSTKKRRPFDPVKHRLQGTEAEDYLKKPKRATVTPTKKDKGNTSWRKKHEEFISIVRAAREAQAYVAKGGKLSDLPPPPPMDTSNLKQCPHCKRKFNEGAAERHIPKCANIRSNKPASGAKTKPVPGRR